MEQSSTNSSAHSSFNQHGVVSVSAYQRSENGSVSFLIMNRIKTKLGTFYDEIDEILCGFRGSGLCQTAPETVSDVEEEEVELMEGEEKEMRAGGEKCREEELCGSVYRDVVTVCHSTRTYSPTMEDQPLPPDSDQCFDVLDSLACQQNLTDSDTDSEVGELGELEVDVGVVPPAHEIGELGVDVGLELPADEGADSCSNISESSCENGEYQSENVNTEVKREETSLINNNCDLKTQPKDKNDEKCESSRVQEDTLTFGKSQDFEFDMVSTRFDPARSETNQPQSLLIENPEESHSKEEAEPLLEECTAESTSNRDPRAGTELGLIQHLIPTANSTDLARYRAQQSPQPATPSPNLLRESKTVYDSSPEYFEVSLNMASPSLYTPSSHTPSPTRFVRILSRSPRPGSLVISSEHFPPDSSPDSLSFNNPFFERSNSKLDEFFKNFNKPASPVTKLFNLSSPKPPDNPKSSTTHLNRSEHCVSSRDWANNSVEDSRFNMNSFSATGVITPDGSRSERYTKITELGEGGFGKVYLARDNDYQERVVLKEMELCKIKLADIAEEIAILDRYPHEHIMKLLDHYCTVSHYCMVYELQSKVSLFDYLRVEGKQGEFEGRVILRQVIDALDWLHDNMIVHGDIKDENMIIECKTKNIILIDFGSARIIKEAYEPISFRGTKIYGPPEAIVRNVVFGKSQDVWMLGTFVYVLLNNRRPFVDDQEILNACLPYPKGWSEGAKDFVRQCLSKDYLDRPTIKLLKFHPWVRS